MIREHRGKVKVKVFIDDRTMTRYECALSAAGVLVVTKETVMLSHVIVRRSKL